jgi:plastin-1
MMAGEKFPHIVLGVVWQLVKIHLLNSINLKNHPELVRLLEAGEELADLLKLPPDQLLLRWFNYHLKRANHKKIHNFSGDVRDSDAYTTLLNQIAPNTCDLAALKDTDMGERAKKVLGNATKLNVKCFIKPRDIVSGNGKLNLIFTAAIFNQCPGLDPLTDDETKKAGLLDDDKGDSREERMFRMWINSLGIDDLYVNSLYQDCRDGLVLLKVLDKVEPGIVSWSKVEKNPNNKFKKIANCQYAVVLGKQLKFSLVGIQGADFEEAKNPKLLLAFVWQLMRYHTFKFLAETQKKKFGGKNVTEQDVIDWANGLVKTQGRNKDLQMGSLNDSVLASGLYFIDLLHAINPKIVDWDVVTKGDNKESALLNCKYVISVARKLGATIFCLPEDINECKPKMITTLLASCMAISPQ